MTGLVMWTIYDRPRDHPDLYVARKWLNDKPTAEAYGHPDIDRLHDLLSNAGLVCLSRRPEDDPQIVEVWL